MKLYSTLFFSLSVCTSFAAQAQQTPQTNQPAMASAQTLEPTAAEIRKIDAEQGKLTLKHGDIKHMNMPGMTMIFNVRDKAELAGWQVGDKLNFIAIREGGKLWATQMQKVKEEK